MNQSPFSNLQANLGGVRQIVMLLLIAWVLGALGLGWLVRSFLLLIGVLLLLPIVGFVGLQWWLRRNLVQGDCPVCQFQLTGLNNTQLQCPSCGEPLRVDDGKVLRQTPVGTIDVEAVDVSAQQIEDA